MEICTRVGDSVPLVEICTWAGQCQDQPLLSTLLLTAPALWKRKQRLYRLPEVPFSFNVLC